MKNINEFESVAGTDNKLPQSSTNQNITNESITSFEEESADKETISKETQNIFYTVEKGSIKIQSQVTDPQIFGFLLEKKEKFQPNHSETIQLKPGCKFSIQKNIPQKANEKISSLTKSPEKATPLLFKKIKIAEKSTNTELKKYNDAEIQTDNVYNAKKEATEKERDLLKDEIKVLKLKFNEKIESLENTCTSLYKKLKERDTEISELKVVKNGCQWSESKVTMLKEKTQINQCLKRHKMAYSEMKEPHRNASNEFFDPKIMQNLKAELESTNKNKETIISRMANTIQSKSEYKKTYSFQDDQKLKGNIAHISNKLDYSNKVNSFLRILPPKTGGFRKKSREILDFDKPTMLLPENPNVNYVFETQNSKFQKNKV